MPKKQWYDRQKGDSLHVAPGIITIHHNGGVVDAEQFKSRAQRKEIIKKWYRLYNLEKKKNVYFQISTL